MQNETALQGPARPSSATIWAKATASATTASGAATGITFRPLDDSIRDCVESLLAVANVPVKRRAADAVEPCGSA